MKKLSELEKDSTAVIASFIPALPLMGVGQLIAGIPDPLNEAMIGAGCPAFIAAIVCDVFLRTLSFVVQMPGFVFGVTLVFGLLEEIGVMARISYVFDNTMSRFGLQGKSAQGIPVKAAAAAGREADHAPPACRRADSGTWA